MEHTHTEKKAARRQKPRAFSLSQAIRTRRVLRFAARFTPLPFAQAMKLAKAEKLTATAFAIA